MSRTKTRSRVWARVAFIVTWTAILLVGATGAFELYWRRVGFDPNAYYTWPPGFHLVFNADTQAMPGVAAPADYRINGMGLRGDLPARGRRLILAVGGSTTEDAFLKLENSWTYQLQHRLRGSWVGNIGKAGTNSLHHALVVEKIGPRLPRLDTILILLGLNDMLWDLGLHRPPGPKYPGYDMAQTFGYRPLEAPGPLGRLAVYHLAVNIWRNWQVSPEAIRTVDGASFVRYKERRRQVLPDDFVDEIPDMTPLLAAYRGHLDRIVSASRGAKVVFVTQPSLWKVNPTPEELAFMYMGGFDTPDVWEKNPRSKWMTPQAMLRALTAYNDETLRFCADRQLSCVDLASELPKEMKYFYDDAHFSDAGAAAVADIIAKYLR